MTWTQLFKVFGFAWLFRKPLSALIEDESKFRSLGEQFSNISNAVEAQFLVKEVLEMKSINLIVQTTETKWDDAQLARLKKLVDEKDIFAAAWRILQGDWRINVGKNRLQLFLQRLKKILPFANPNMPQLEEAASSNSTALGVIEINDERTEMGVLDIISLIVLLVQILPKIAEILRR